MSGREPKLPVLYLDDGGELTLPSKFEVCPRCRGEGSHVNPAIDGNGISPSEFADDPDFEEAYFGGVYDVACYSCKGARVVAVVDRSRMTADQVKAWDVQVQELADMEAEEAAERRMGA